MSEKKSKDKYDPPEDDADYGLPEVKITALQGAGNKEKTIPPVANATSGKVENPKKEEKKKSNNSVLLLLLLLLLFLMGGYGLYHYNIFGIRDSKDNVTAEKEVTPAVPDATLDREPEIQPPVAVVPEEEDEIKLTEITSRIDSPRYFVVVGSFIDDDLARDFSNRLNNKEMSTFLIHPYGNINFYRLSVGAFDNLEQAVSKMETIQKDFEENLWVLKY